MTIRRAAQSVPYSNDDVFVYVPPRLNFAHLASVLSQRLGRDATISDCKATNLCAHNWGGVSNSGATLLRLSLTLDDSHALDLVAKILFPDPVNLFKVDCRFSSRLAEVAWVDTAKPPGSSAFPLGCDTKLCK